MRGAAGTRLVIATFVLLAACTAEQPVPIELDSSGDPDPTILHSPDPLDSGDDPNAAARAQAIGFAEQQCIDDPTKDEGVVQIAEPDTGAVVAEFRVDCSEVREGAP